MRKNEFGQSTIEFALSMSMALAFVFFFIHLSMLFAYGNLVHYATFMAARAYLAASASNEEQVQRAKDTVAILLKKSVAQPGLDKYPFIAIGDGGTDIPGLFVGPGPKYVEKNTGFSWMEGVRYRFKARIVPVPLSAGKGKDNILTLQSESWLSREPSTAECEIYLDKIQGGVTFDNGC